jgi:exonuclease VII small subunit
MNRNLKSRIQRLERQMRLEGRGTAADERLRQRLQAARKRVAENRENEARQKEEEEEAA